VKPTDCFTFFYISQLNLTWYRYYTNERNVFR